MNAALRPGGALLAVGMVLWGLNIPKSVLAQSRPYNPLVRKVAAEEPLPAPAENEPPKPKAHPSPFRPAANQGWQAIQPPGSSRPPIIVPPVSARQVPYYDEGAKSEDLPAPGPAAARPSGPRGVNGPPEFGSPHWDDGSPWPGGEGHFSPHHGEPCGDGCGADCGGCGADCGGCGACDDCGPRFTLLHCIWPRNCAVLGGVHAFKGPVDQGRNGNFGFHAGLNGAGLIKPCCGLGYQVGAQVFASNFSGDQVAQTSTDEREQFFFTTGLFRKGVQCWDWQGGVVFDLLHDDYYVDMTLTQIRAELSLVGPNRHEIGVWVTSGLEDDTAQDANEHLERWEPTDLYAFFYRKNLDCGVSCRAWAGFTGSSDSLIGGDLNLPLTDSLALLCGFNYLIPDEGTPLDISEESWSLAINLAWYPGCKARCLVTRPLFNVADNGTFMVDRRNR